MPIDYETVRSNARRDQGTPPGDWDAKESAMVAEYRAELAKQHEQESHQADVKAYAKFASGKAEAARKNRNDDDAKVWDAAAENIE